MPFSHNLARHTWDDHVWLTGQPKLSPNWHQTAHKYCMIQEKCLVCNGKNLWYMIYIYIYIIYDMIWICCIYKGQNEQLFDVISFTTLVQGLFLLLAAKGFQERVRRVPSAGWSVQGLGLDGCPEGQGHSGREIQAVWTKRKREPTFVTRNCTG